MPDPMGSLPGFVVTLRSASGLPAGLGVLVDAQTVLTCAHVVNLALGRAAAATSAPDSAVNIEWPHLARQAPVRATVSRWSPLETDDLAALTFTGALPPGAVPAKFAIGASGGSFRAYGYPQGHRKGQWVRSITVAGRVERDWLQLDSEALASPAVRVGYSGSPVHHPVTEVVIGLIAEAPGGGDARDSLAVPTEQLLRFNPDLLLVGPQSRRVRSVQAPAPDGNVTDDDGWGPNSQYLQGLSDQHRSLLARVNRRGLELLRKQLADRQAVAFLGAGTSAPLYPLWQEVVSDLVEQAEDRWPAEQATTYRAQARNSPDAVLQIVQETLGDVAFREALRELFRARRDPDTGRSSTEVQELIARCNFRGIVTTNFDQGIVNARMAVRPQAAGTGFASWTDEDALDSWRTGDVFMADELPVLYAHGHHNQPDAIVLATTDYRRAYRSGLKRVLGNLLETGHVVWIGFSFADHRITAILKEIGEGAGPARSPGRAPRHVAVLPWTPPTDTVESAVREPAALARLAEIEYGCHVVLYPTPAGDHEALAILLNELVDDRYLPADVRPELRPVRRAESAVAAESEVEGATALEGTDEADDRPPQLWFHGGAMSPKFAGRAEQLNQLDRWAEDPEVRLVAVTAWGGAGKTSLVTQWIQALHGIARRPALRGCFAWSFYDDNSVENWGAALLTWCEDELGVPSGEGDLVERLFTVLTDLPLMLVLDGLEVNQEATDGHDFGRLLDGTLRTVLTLFAALDQPALAVLTSRFPFADLEASIGGATRVMDVPPLSPDEGAELLRSSGASWLPAAERVALVRAVDGHALALGVLAAALAGRPPEDDLQGLLSDLAEATRTNTRVAKVLEFYSRKLDESDRRLIAVVSLFQRPVNVPTICRVAALAAPDSVLAGWSPAEVTDAIRRRLFGLLGWNPDATVTAHPLVREAFRPFVLTGRTAQYTSDVVLADLPRGPVRTVEDARRVVEMIELLILAEQWQAADDLYRTRSNNGAVWRDLPAAPLGRNAAKAFVVPNDRRERCLAALGPVRVIQYLNTAGVCAAYTGDVAQAELLLSSSTEQLQREGDEQNLSIVLRSRADLAAAAGNLDDARELADQAVTLATTSRNRRQLEFARASSAVAEHLAGAHRQAEQLLSLLGPITDRLLRPDSTYIDTMVGIMTAKILVDTERTGAARQVVHGFLDRCIEFGWHADEQRCRVLLGRCHLIESDAVSALPLMEAATAAYRDADHVLPLTDALADLAEAHRRTGDLGAAEKAAQEAISLAGPRGLVPSHARALAVRATVHAELTAVAGDSAGFAKARDYADSALTLSTRTRQLPWCELAALLAHAQIDALQNQDQGWAEQAANLREQLYPTPSEPSA